MQRLIQNIVTHKRALCTLVFSLAAAVPMLWWLHQLAFMRGAAGVDTIYAHIYINDVEVGGLTKEEALYKVTQHFQPALEEKKIQITEGGRPVAAISFKDVEACYDFSALVEEAWQYGRTGPYRQRYKQISGLAHEPKAINGPPLYRYNPSLLEKRLPQLLSPLAVAPVNARLTREQGIVSVVEGKAGKTPDTAAALTAARAFLDAGREGAFEVTYTPVPPQYMAADFSYEKTMIGQYETLYKGADTDARNINLRVAAKRIDNQMLYPGEVFSTSAALGRITEENGYTRAVVIVDGKPVEDFGGGVCQAVTTLYNAVLYAELPVVERFNHSVGVSYADYGYDATVAGNYFDLKFKNDTPYPLLIMCDMQQGRIGIGLYGYEVHNATRTLVFDGVLVETTPPAPDKVQKDERLRPGDKVVAVTPQYGYRYDIYKLIYEDGRMMGKEKVNTSVYKPVQGVIKVGG